MKRSTSTLVTRVFTYGLPLGPTTNADVVKDQMYASNRYFNARLELEKARRAAWKEENSVWVEIAEQVAALDLQIEDIKSVRAKRRSHLGYQKHRIAQGTRFEPLSEEERAAGAFTDIEQAGIKKLKTQKKLLNEKKKGVRPTPEIEAALLSEEIYWKNCLYSTSTLYSRSKDLIEDAFAQIRKTPQSDVRFKRPTGEGNLAVRFTSDGGGISKSEIFSCQDTRIRIEMVRDGKEGTKRARAIVHFRVKSDDKRKPIWATFPMKYHRELPDDACVKLIKLVAFRRGTEMKYELQLTFTSATFTSFARTPTGLTAGMDIGWRGAIRVGYLADSNGGSQELALPSAIKDRIEHAQSIRSRADMLFNDNLVFLIEWLKLSIALPEWFEKRLSTREGIRSVHAWKAHGRLERLVREWRNNRFPGDEAIFSVMDDWARQERHLYQWWSNEDTKARGFRRDFYLNLAKTMVLKYDTVYVEDLEGDRMAKSGVAGGTRFVVAPFEFRDALKKAGEKWGCHIVKVPAAGTSRRCNDCGHDEPWENKSELEHACEGCGVVFDRDQNAAWNILRAGQDKVAEKAAA